jgi:hypothetical protein
LNSILISTFSGFAEATQQRIPAFHSPDPKNANSAFPRSRLRRPETSAIPH